MTEGNPPCISPSTVDESQEVLLRDDHGDYVLDIGAGDFPFTRYLRENVDESSYVIATDREVPPQTTYETLGGNADIVFGESADFIQEDSVQQAYAINVIQDTNDPRKFLKSVQSALMPGGEMILTFPDQDWKDYWPDRSTVEKEESENESQFDKLSVGLPGNKPPFEQYFIESEWLESQAERLGMEIEEEGRVAVNGEAIPVIREFADDPKELPDNSEEIPEVKYYVLEEKKIL